MFSSTRRLLNASLRYALSPASEMSADGGPTSAATPRTTTGMTRHSLKRTSGRERSTARPYPGTHRWRCGRGVRGSPGPERRAWLFHFVIVALRSEVMKEDKEVSGDAVRALIPAWRECCRRFAAWAGGYVHSDAHHLLRGVITPTDADSVDIEARRISTSEWAFDSHATDGTTLDVVDTGARSRIMMDRNDHGATLLTPPRESLATATRRRWLGSTPPLTANSGPPPSARRFPPPTSTIRMLSVRASWRTRLTCVSSRPPTARGTTRAPRRARTPTVA